MKAGWVKLHRSFWASDAAKLPGRSIAVPLWLVSMANREPTHWLCPSCGCGTMLGRGEVCTSARAIARVLGIHHSTAQSALDRLVDIGFATLSEPPCRHVNLLLVVKYDRYQSRASVSVETKAIGLQTETNGVFGDQSLVSSETTHRSPKPRLVVSDETNVPIPRSRKEDSYKEGAGGAEVLTLTPDRRSAIRALRTAHEAALGLDAGQLAIEYDQHAAAIATLPVDLGELRDAIEWLGIGAHQHGHEGAQKLLDALTSAFSWRRNWGEITRAEHLIRWRRRMQATKQAQAQEARR